MKNTIATTLLGIVIYLAVCIMIGLNVEPFSEVSIIGPAAGIASAIVVAWGMVGIISVILGTILYCLYLHVFLQIPISIAIWTVSLLAILFQAIWARQLTYPFIANQKWLESRATLFSFIYRVGVIASLVSAICSLIIATFSLNTLQTPLTYVFFVGWAGSLLVSVFVIPTLLFFKGYQQLSLSKRFFIIVASILGSVAIAILFKISQYNNQHLRLDKFDLASTGAQNEIAETIKHIDAQLTSLSALFKASDYVTVSEFNQFVSSIFIQNKSVKALQWIPAVFASDTSNFEYFATDQLGIDFHIFQQHEFTQSTHPVPEMHFPVLYTYPTERTMLGLDNNGHAAKVKAINKAMNAVHAVATAPIVLTHNKSKSPSLVVFQRIVNAPNLNSFGYVINMQGDKIIGFVTAIVQFEHIINKITANYGDDITMSIHDVTSREAYIISDNARANPEQLQLVKHLDVFGRQWRIKISESTPWIMQEKSWQSWAMVAGGTIGGFLFQLLILMMAAYSTELSYKVGLKTRELIAAKELSDKDNETKTQFLQTLSTELSASLSSVVDFLVKVKLSKHGSISPALYSDLSGASDRLGQLVDSINDLSLLNLHATPIENRIFDFYSFMNDIEREYDSSDVVNAKRIKVIIDNNAPHHVKTDPALLKKMLLALKPNIVELFGDYDVQLTIKPHIHQYHATLFLTCSAINYSEDDGLPLPIEAWLEKDLANYSTSMALVKELCLLLDGDVKLSKLPSGSAILTLSIRMSIEEQVGRTVSSSGILPKARDTRSIILVEEPLSTNFEITPLLLGLDFQVEIIDDATELFERLSEDEFEMIIIDNVTLRPLLEQIEQRILEWDKGSLPPILGVYRGIESRQLPSEFKHCISDFLAYPVDEERLHKAIIALCK